MFTSMPYLIQIQAQTAPEITQPLYEVMYIYCNSRNNPTNNMPIYIYNRHAEKHIQGTQIHTNYKQYNIILALGNISQLLPQ